MAYNNQCVVLVDETFQNMTNKKIPLIKIPQDHKIASIQDPLIFLLKIHYLSKIRRNKKQDPA